MHGVMPGLRYAQNYLRSGVSLVCLSKFAAKMHHSFLRKGNVVI